MIDHSQSSISTMFTQSSSSSFDNTRIYLAPTGSTSPSQQKETEVVEEPLPEDILCGKNKECIKHKGSRDFRALIDGYSAQYQQAQTRQEKMDITKTIFDRLEHHRFLKYDEDQKVWRTLHPLAVRDKIGHALRFSNRKGQGTASASRRKIRRSPSASSQSTFDSCESGMSSSYRSACASPLPNRSVSTNLTPSGDYYEMVQLAAQMDIRGIDVGVGKDNNNMAYSYGGQHPRLPSMVMIPPKQSESVLDFRPFEEDPEDEDLSWILKIPLLEVNENNEIFFVKQS